MQVVDRVLFRMPLDRELQFPAMAVVQAFVRGFNDKMRVSDVSRGVATYDLAWDVSMPEEDFRFFLDAGAKFGNVRTRHLVPDMIVDLTDERLEQYKDSGKHACQVCGIMSGVACMPVPSLRQVMPRLKNKVWGVVGAKAINTDYPLVPLTIEHLLEAEAESYTGVVGYAGVETYLAAAMGIAVVEVLPPGRPRNWLTKWQNKGYRLIDTPDESKWPLQIAYAMASAEAVVDHMQRNLFDGQEVA